VWAECWFVWWWDEYRRQARVQEAALGCVLSERGGRHPMPRIVGANRQTIFARFILPL